MENSSQVLHSAPEILGHILAKLAGIYPVHPYPERLYHYTSAQGLVGILKSHVLWATDSRCLNDTQEFKLGLKIALDILAGHNQFQFLRKVIDDVISSWTPQVAGVFVICFCRDRDLLSQWRAFGSDGRGYCLGFDMQGMMTGAAGGSHMLALEGSIGKLIYERATAEDLFREMLEGLWPVLEPKVLRWSALPAERKKQERQIEVTVEQLCQAITLLSGFIKDRSFREEQEVRALIVRKFDDTVETAEGASRPVVNARLNPKGMLVPYVETPFRRVNDSLESSRSGIPEGEPPTLPLAEIVLPPQAPDPLLAKAAVETLLRQHGYDLGKVTVRESEVRSYRSYIW